MQLAGCGCRVRTVWSTVNRHAAGSTNAFPTIMIKLDHATSLGNPFLVDEIQCFQEGHLRFNLIGNMDFKVARGFRTILHPDTKGDLHVSGSSW